MPRFLSFALSVPACLALAPSAAAAPGDDAGYHPYTEMPSGPLQLDGSLAGREAMRAKYVKGTVETDQPIPGRLDEVAANPPPPRDATPGKLPAGWVQQGGVVMPEEVARGLKVVDPEPLAAWEDIPGNKYPRKHTVYMNFQGGMLYSGPDNSAESKSSLAKQGIYPTFGGGNSTAIAAANAFMNDVSKYGIRVMYETRPSKLVPYTMVMVGGDWTDTNLEDPAGGVAPGADCEAHGQRHVVYTFMDSGATGIANVSSQEAGHAWGLDHSLNCNSVMAYCGSGDKYFSTACDGVCEGQCQGPAGCMATHEKHCGVGSDEQNEDAELTFIFGGNEPDMEPPTVEILEPMNGAVFQEGGDVVLRGDVDDNYGGVGWALYVEHDGDVVLDAVDYSKKYLNDANEPTVIVTAIAPGTWKFRITAEDHANPQVSAEVTFTVEAGAGSGTTGATSGTTSGTGTSGGSATTSSGTTSGGSATSGVSDTAGSSGGVSGATDTDGTGVVDSESGCGCSTDPTPAGFLGLALLPLLGLRRRRR
jgi:MYXO-CTERM domain-containing protein